MLAHLAFDTGRGPTVVPLLFTEWDGRLWMVVPHSSVKAKALRKRPRCAVLVGDAVVRGDAVVHDSIPEAVAAAPAFASFVVRNGPSLVGLVSRAVPTLVTRRVLVSVPLDDPEPIGDGADVVAWLTPDGPMLARSTDGVPDGPVAVGTAGDGISGQTVRGRLRGGHLEAERVTTWDGPHVETTDVAASDH